MSALPTKAAPFERTLTPAVLAEAIERLAAACDPLAILAFGSRARGDSHPDSDLDLLVLLRAPVADRFHEGCRLRALLDDLPVAKDVLLADPDHFARWRHHPNSVFRYADADGIVLWQDGRLDHDGITRVRC